jgi:simple sugar transport system ATP-binding protein
VTDSRETVLSLSGISKRFGDVVANDAITLELRRGEVLALLGENGAGKSTLVSILFGHYVADAGTVTAFGEPLRGGDPAAALAAGIGMVHQHFTLADNLSVEDNVLLGTQPLWSPRTHRTAARAKLAAAAERFGLRVDPAARVGTLSVGERQRVEILKALYRDARILILDEPTSVLTPQESEVLRVSHRIAVLRGGRLVATLDAADASADRLAEAMVAAACACRCRAIIGEATSYARSRSCASPVSNAVLRSTTYRLRCGRARSSASSACPATARTRSRTCCAACARRSRAACNSAVA